MDYDCGIWLFYVKFRCFVRSLVALCAIWSYVHLILHCCCCTGNLVVAWVRIVELDLRVRLFSMKTVFVFRTLSLLF